MVDERRNAAGMSLLIVDDVPLNLKILRAQLEAEGCSVVAASDGLEALAALEHRPFDGVISDVQMPQMDGFRLCMAIRGNERLRGLPFVFYTATYTTASDHELGESLGADAYIVKPATVGIIIDTLRNAQRSEARAEPGADRDIVNLYGAALTRKIRDEKQLVARQSLQYAISRMLGEAQTIEEVVPNVIGAMCDTLNWACGAYWSWDESRRTFACVHTASASAPAQGTQSRGAPALTADPAQCGSAPLPETATLRSAALLPINIESRPIGILQFFTTHPRTPDASALQCAEAIALHIGQFAARVAAQEELRQLAHFDPLTGLPNCNLFRELAVKAFARAQRSRKPLALLFVDLDGFKQVNDRFGHHTGDRVLAAFASRVRDALRGSDTIARRVEPAAARLGGDEFVVLVDDFEEWSALETIAQKILTAAGAPFDLSASSQCRIGASVGIAVYPDHGLDLHTLKRAADSAMYRAKQAGKNTYRFAEIPAHDAHPRTIADHGLPV